MWPGMPLIRHLYGICRVGEDARLLENRYRILARRER